MTKYGSLGVEAGERCSNSPWVEYYTSPCCYADFQGDRDTCPECGTAIQCEIEQQPVRVCTVSEQPA